MNHTLKIENDIAIVTVREKVLDVTNSNEFKNILATYLKSYRYFAFDMTKVEFIDSSGITTLLWCLRHVEKQEGAMNLFGLRKQVIALLELVRMQKVFNIYENLEQALASFS